MKNGFTLILTLFFCALSSLFGQTTYLYCGKLIDGKSDASVAERTVIVKNGKIHAIENGYKIAPDSAETIDLKNKTLLPGLIDCHVHLEWEQSKNSYNERFILNEADVAFRSVIYAEKTLLAGFTTVRDLGGQGVNLSLRNAINGGWVRGPRIVCAGKALSITGGHGDHTTGAKEDLFDAPLPEDGIADGPDACRLAVRNQVKRGADCIKVCATGGVLSLARDGRRPQYAQDELDIIVKTAKDFGIHVAAHAHGDEGMRRAVEAGVNSIEHGTFMSEETMEAMKKYGTFYVPTLTAGWAVTDSARFSPGFFPSVVQVKAMDIGPQMMQTIEKAHKKGVKIAFGTDAGVFPHGLNRLEFLLLEKGGMKPMEAIKSATYNAAELLRMSDKIGTIEVGKFADFIAVEGDPSLDMKAIMDLRFVMKNGIVVFEK